MSPEEWRKRKDSLRHFCMGGGKGCSVLMLYFRKNNFKNNIANNKLKREILSE